jgi:hypothetical protein
MGHTGAFCMALYMNDECLLGLRLATECRSDVTCLLGSHKLILIMFERVHNLKFK